MKVGVVKETLPGERRVALVDLDLLRSSLHDTTMPVGLCVMRIADSVLLTC